MQVLRVNLTFKLPEGTAGLAASLRSLADHVEAEDTRTEPPEAACFGENWSAFTWNLERGINLTGKAAIFDANGYSFERLPLGNVGGFTFAPEPDLWLK